MSQSLATIIGDGLGSINLKRAKHFCEANFGTCWMRSEVQSKFQNSGTSVVSILQVKKVSFIFCQ